MCILPPFEHVAMTDSFLDYFITPFVEKGTSHCSLQTCTVLIAISPFFLSFFLSFFVVILPNCSGVAAAPRASCKVFCHGANDEGTGTGQGHDKEEGSGKPGQGGGRMYRMRNQFGFPHAGRLGSTVAELWRWIPSV